MGVGLGICGGAVRVRQECMNHGSGFTVRTHGRASVPRRFVLDFEAIVKRAKRIETQNPQQINLPRVSLEGWSS